MHGQANIIGGRQHRRCIIPQAVTHSLVLPKMGKIIARKMLSWLELLISRYCCIWLVFCIIYTNYAQSSKYQIMKYICWSNIEKKVLWRVAKRLSYIEDARCLKVNVYWNKCKLHNDNKKRRNAFVSRDVLLGVS